MSQEGTSGAVMGFSVSFSLLCVGGEINDAVILFSFTHLNQYSPQRAKWHQPTLALNGVSAFVNKLTINMIIAHHRALQSAINLSSAQQRQQQRELIIKSEK